MCSIEDSEWISHDISGPEGIKFDNLLLLDLDKDGDMDIISTEERQMSFNKSNGLGVVWYENPFSIKDYLLKFLNQFMEKG